MILQHAHKEVQQLFWLIVNNLLPSDRTCRGVWVNGVNPIRGFKWAISWRRTIEGRKGSEPTALFTYLGLRSTLKRCNESRTPMRGEKTVINVFIFKPSLFEWSPWQWICLSAIILIWNLLKKKPARESLSFPTLKTLSLPLQIRSVNIANPSEPCSRLLCLLVLPSFFWLWHHLWDWRVFLSPPAGYDALHIVFVHEGCCV